VGWRGHLQFGGEPLVVLLISEAGARYQREMARGGLESEAVLIGFDNNLK
jgi:hypothetical protein